MADSNQEQKFFTYKGRPLVRCGDEIYYGNMEEPYVIRLQIKSKKEVGGEEIAVMRNPQFIRVIVYLLGSAASLLAAAVINQRKCKALADHARKMESLNAKEAA